MRDLDQNRSAIQRMLASATAAAGVRGLTLGTVEILPFRGTTQVVAIASYAGPATHDAMVAVSEEIADRVCAGFGGSWRFADRIEADHDDRGFRLHIGFDTAETVTA